MPRKRNTFKESLRTEFFMGGRLPTCFCVLPYLAFSHGPIPYSSQLPACWGSAIPHCFSSFIYTMFPPHRMHSTRSPTWLRSTLKAQNNCLHLLEPFPDSLLGFTHVSIMIRLRLYYDLFTSHLPL